MRERLVLCGGVKGKRDDDALKLALNGRNKNINYESDQIPVRLCASLTPRLLDLLEIATFIYCADQATGRGGMAQANMGAAWRRNFRFVVPVRDPDHWSRADIVERLSLTVGFLSDDNYCFEFDRIIDPPASQAYLPFDESAGVTFSPNVVIPFSGGLDSLAGAIEELSVRNRRVVLISHRASSKILDHQKQLVKKLSTRFPKRLLHIPVLVTTQERLLIRDYNQRSRSFLYAALACAVAHTLGVGNIRFFENGIVSINLPISEQVVGSRATRTTHPRVIKDFSEFFEAALGSSIDVENPYLWRTKRDVIDTIVDNDCGGLINDSISCTRVHEMTRLHTHCGRCSQCIDRRFAILAAKAEAYDSADQYACDLLTSPREDALDRTMAESYVRMAVQIGRMNDVAFFSNFGGNVASLLDCFSSMSADEVGQSVYNLYQRHAANITQVMTSAVAEQSADLIGQSLPASSVLVMSVSKGVLATPGMSRTLDRIANFWTEEETNEHAESVSAPSLPLQLAIDHQTGDVVVRGVARLTGINSRLICALEALHREDRQAERTPENYRFIKSDELADVLDYEDEVAVRQRVSRCRKEVEEAFHQVHDERLPREGLIETHKPDGYRLNPNIRVVAMSEIAGDSTVSHRARHAVTRRTERA